ncbi:maltodextrin glucosidase [Saccharobesus litoralis]|uniref:Maltodextrin glucosidase n=1 Tax=Saccharobesus litoralis TaxID=2172099 RepID=A0A2S0VM37_9ALTE|nr:maltodextrin glucosidase [Saccharobesus litoralis]AWB65180.1 maltodextrin glucosidase [Saccharobesus litoralis]
MLAWHIQTEPMLVRKGNQVKLKLAVSPNYDLDAAWVRVEPDNEEALKPLKKTNTKFIGFDVYSVTIAINDHQEMTPYAFKLQSGSQVSWLGANGLNLFPPTLDVQFKLLATTQIPDWVPSQVFYQIFPERFCNGDANLSPKQAEYDYLDWGPIIAKEWGSLPEAKVGGIEFYGGDLIGVRQKLDYLQELGITAIYLNPVFESLSNHKYDTVDYFNVDPHFGGNQALIDLTTDVHQRDMRIVLDAVINHTSAAHPWFLKAHQGDPNYRHYYIFDENNYFQSWKGYDTLPVLDYSQADIVDIFYQNENSVLKHWLRPPYNIDGWRMDVIHMLGEGKGATNNLHHIEKMRTAVKTENQQAYFVGEHFFEASRWLQGNAEDAAMNYFGFAFPVWGFLAGKDVNYHDAWINAETLALWMQSARARIAYSLQLGQFNLIDSHDTARFASLVNGDQDKIKLAMTLLLTYPGIPSIYYGDEVGLKGWLDPDCRRTMPWNIEHSEHPIYQHLQQMIRLRKKYKALQYGGFVELYAQGNVFIFARVYKKQLVIVAINRGDACDIRLAPELNEFIVLGWPQAKGIIELTANSSLVLPIELS